MKKVILITGCCGQVGSQIYNYLVLHQKAKVIASDIKLSADQFKFYEQINSGYEKNDFIRLLNSKLN